MKQNDVFATKAIVCDPNVTSPYSSCLVGKVSGMREFIVTKTKLLLPSLLYVNSILCMCLLLGAILKLAQPKLITVVTKQSHFPWRKSKEGSF